MNLVQIANPGNGTADLFSQRKTKAIGVTQKEFADRAGVALTVIRKIEQGKGNLQLEKVNHVLLMFGHTLAPIPHKDIILHLNEVPLALSALIFVSFT